MLSVTISSQDILYSATKQKKLMAKNAKRAKVTDKPTLWAAVERGDEDTVHRLLTLCCDVDERYRGWTPLMKAAEKATR